MADVVVRRFDDLPRGQIAGAEMVFARAGMGITSFGLQEERLPPGLSVEQRPERACLAPAGAPNGLRSAKPGR
jgi:hypothetical protein